MSEEAPAIQPRRTVIDSNTVVSISLVGAIIGATIWATRIDDRLASIDEKLESFIDGHHIESWVEVLRARNPGMEVPEFRRGRQ